MSSYKDHSREPSFHSWIKPKRRISKNISKGNKNRYCLEENEIIGIGIKRTISISNTRNNTANKKNRILKGSRAVDFGSNPHSKGDLFSRSCDDRDIIIFARSKSKVGIRIAKSKLIDVRTIHLRHLVFYSLKGYCLYKAS